MSKQNKAESALGVAEGSERHTLWQGISASSSGVYHELINTQHSCLSPEEFRRTIMIAVLLGRQIETELSSPNDQDQTRPLDKL